MTSKTIFCGENKLFLSKMTDSSVDLIYIDPPFIDYSRQTQSNAQIDHDAVTAEYLDWIEPCIRELHRVLKSTGTLYFHCASESDAYIRILLNKVFGVDNYLSKIVWQTNSAIIDMAANKSFAKTYDSIIVFSKTKDYVFNNAYSENDLTNAEVKYKFQEETGRKFALEDLSSINKDRPNNFYEFLGVTRTWRYSQDRMNELLQQGRIYQKEPGHVPYQKRYLDERKGKPIGDIWTDITFRHAFTDSISKKYLGQKPTTLLERVIKASSNPGDIVLDAFCGTGTTLFVAESLNREWIGLDVSKEACSITRERLYKRFNLVENIDFNFIDDTDKQYKLF